MNKILSMTKDIEKSFKSQNRLTVVAVAGSLLFALVVGVYALTFAEKQREKIYVLDQGKSLLLALQTDAILSKDVEIRDHVTRFHELMFTLSPQKQTIQENLDRAFNLADRSAYEFWPTGVPMSIRRTWPKRDTIRAWYRPISPSR